MYILKRMKTTQIVYAGEPIPATITKSLFLAGLTPRSEDVKLWRSHRLYY